MLKSNHELRLRPYIPCRDFDIIRSWITQPREHAMWCAGRTKFPIERGDFHRMLDDIAQRSGDSPFIVASWDGKPVGFFCYSVNIESNEGMFKFVMIDPARRGKGYGKKMLRIAAGYAFEFTGADSVKLCVLSANTGAKRCYESVGFKECGRDEGAFSFGDELWDRCHMTIERRLYADVE